MAAPAIEVAVCYARDDEDDLKKLLQQLRALERAGLIHIWNDREILAGTPYAQEIEKHLDAAQIILLIASAGFIASDYCYEKELPRALARHKDGSARVLTVLLHPCDWQITALKQFKALPGNGQPISDAAHWPNQHNALVNINEGIKRVALELQIAELLRLGEAANAARQYDEARTTFDEALSLIEQHQEAELATPASMARLYQGKGIALIEPSRTGEPSKALTLSEKEHVLEVFEQALQLDHTLLYSYEHKGTLLYELGRCQEALPALDEAIRLGNEQRRQGVVVPLSPFMTKYHVLLDLKRTDEALELYEQVFTPWPSDNQLHQQAAKLYEQAGRYEQALAACERAYKKSEFAYYESKARLLEHLECYEEALATLLECEQEVILSQKVKILSNVQITFYVKKGLLLELLGRDQEALAAFDEGISPPFSFIKILRNFSPGDNSKEEATLDKRVRDFLWSHEPGQAYFGRQRIYERLARQAGEMVTSQGYVGRFRPVHTWQGHNTLVFGLACSPAEHLFASCGEDGAIRLWDLSSGQMLRVVQEYTEGGSPRHTNAVVSITFSPDGKRLASGYGDGTVRIWDLASGEELMKFSHRASGPLRNRVTAVLSMDFSPNGSLLASSSLTDGVRIWDLVAHQELNSWPVPSDHSRNFPTVGVVLFSPDGRSLASGSADGIARLWNPTTGAELLTLYGHTQEILSAAFSPDGRFLASGSADHTIAIWDLASSQQPRVLSGHTDDVENVVFSPDGRFLVSGSADGSIKYWDFASGEEIQTLDHGSVVQSLALSRDGYTLISGGEDGTLKLWRLQ